MIIKVFAIEFENEHKMFIKADSKSFLLFYLKVNTKFLLIKVNMNFKLSNYMH